MNAKDEPNGGRVDPGNYRQMWEPFSDSKAADETLKLFFDGVYRLRNELGIADVVLVIRDSIADADREGGEGLFLTMQTIGDSLKAQSMLAWAFGKAQADDKNRIMAILARAARHD
jgi:hypothetical protein